MKNLRGKEAINKLTGVVPAVFSPEIRGKMSLPSKVVINDNHASRGPPDPGSCSDTGRVRKDRGVPCQRPQRAH